MAEYANLDDIEELPRGLIGEILDELNPLASASRGDQARAVEREAAKRGLSVGRIEDDPAVVLPGWACSAYGQPHIYISERSSREAAERYVAEGEWGSDLETSWIHVYAEPVGVTPDGRVGLIDEGLLRRDHLIPIEPEEPPCTGDSHDWASPWEVVGGLEDNPGVQGNGGGVVISEVCSRCGWYRLTDTWAQDPETGVQGLRAVEYRPPDEESLAFAEAGGTEE